MMPSDQEPMSSNEPELKPDSSRLHQTSISPNSVGDRPTVEDTLGFTPYVAAVAAFLTHKETKPPLTLSIEGAWGTGKSSFMRQLEDRLNPKQQKKGVRNWVKWLLKNKAKTKTVWFNAWRLEREDEVWATFAL